MGHTPNLIYILADDMGYGDVSCLNPQSAFQTPHIDRLAREGMAFTDAHASSAVCTPSRYSILTGRYNWRSPLKSGVLMGDSPRLIERDRHTVAHLLRERGYRTGCIGKWHLGLDWATDDAGDIDFTRPIAGGPLTCGFDAFFGISASLDMAPYAYIQDDHVVEQPTDWYPGVPAAEGDAPTAAYARPGPISPSFRHEDVLPTLLEKTLQHIRDWKSGPFFLYVPLNAPHTPILPSEAFRGKSNTNAYGDFCLMIDDFVGQVMRCLEQEGLADDTILAFTSDNGCSPHANFPELLAKGHNPSYHFRGHKADLFEGGHRVPYIVRWPGGMRAGRTCDETVCLTDLYATMADLLGADIAGDAAVDSVSNLPLWRGDERDAPVREVTVHQSIDGSLAIRKGEYKLLMCPGSGGWSAPRPGSAQEVGLPEYQLYHLGRDVSERVNLQDADPAIVAELKARLAAIVLEGRSTPGPRQENSGADVWETVRWLEGMR